MAPVAHMHMAPVAHMYMAPVAHMYMAPVAHMYMAPVAHMYMAPYFPGLVEVLLIKDGGVKLVSYSLNHYSNIRLYARPSYDIIGKQLSTEKKTVLCSMV
jgi:hypothetical protein